MEKALDTLAQERSAPTGSDGAPTAGIHFTFPRTWHDEPHFLQLLAQRVTAARERLFRDSERDAVHIIFSAHSLPQRVLTWGDPYPVELQATVAGVTRLLALDESRWTFAYQSAGRTPEPWLGPTIHEVIAQLANQGVKAALVCPVGFIADNLEILYDIDLDCREVAAQVGLHLERIEMPNTDPLLLEALAQVVLHATPAPASAEAGPRQ